MSVEVICGEVVSQSGPFSGRLRDIYSGGVVSHLCQSRASVLAKHTIQMCSGLADQAGDGATNRTI